MIENISTRIFPVIHCGFNLVSILEQIFIAYDCGADGVFLIHHNLEPCKFSELIDKLDYLAVSKYKNDPKKWPPDFLVGVNYLGANPLQAVNLLKPWMSNLWSDLNGIYLETSGAESSVAEATVDKIKSIGNINSEFFGGIAFKYQEQPDYEDLYRLISVACSIDGYIVTTSGDATGSAPAVEKIREMRSMMPSNKRLAVASGISISNVEGLVNAGVTDILVSSSVSNNDILDSKKLRRLVNKAKGNEVKDD